MDFIDYFDCLSPEELILIASAFAIAISSNLTVLQINSLGNFLQALGQDLEVIASQKSLKDSCDENSNKQT